MTRRCSRNRVGLAYITLALLGGAIACLRTPAGADTHSYASSKRQIKACVIVSNAAAYTAGGVVIPENAVPYTFYMLDRRTDLKPAGWEFVNPLAPSTVTGTIRQRWLARDSSSIDATLANPAFALGAPLTKNIGAYWEVNLDTIALTDLKQFDIVLLAYHTSTTAFSPNEREILRKYVDAGGTIWLEDEGGFDIQSFGSHLQNQFVIDTAFDGATINAANTPSLATIHHPLVNFPFPISNISVKALGAAGLGVHHTAIDPVSGPVNPRDVAPVIWSGPASNAVPLVYAGDYGAGHIVVSSAGIATGINSYAGGSSVANENGNSGAVSGENTLGVQLTDAEFALNMISWTSSVSTGAINVRRSGGSLEDIGNGLGVRWSTVPGAAPSSRDSGPAIYKNCAFYVDGNNMLRCYDLSPAEDLDLDGNPDDGYPDYINGSPYDEVWQISLVGLSGTGYSSTTRFGTPTLFTVNNNGTVIDEVAVQGSNGVTAVFNAFTLTGAGVLAPAPTQLYTIEGAGGTGADFGGSLINQHGGQPFAAPSAGYSDGILFSIVYDSQSGANTDTNDAWRIFPSDGITGQNVFGSNKLGVAPTTQPFINGATVAGMSNPVGSPIVGYINDFSTGAQDKIIQVPCLPDENTLNSGGGGQIYSFLYSVKNDPLIDVSTTVTYVPTGTNYGIDQRAVPLAGVAFRATMTRGGIPWFVPSLPYSGNRSMLPVLHRITNGVSHDMQYDPNGSLGSFQVEFLIDPSQSASLAGAPTHQIWVLPNPPLQPGETLSADYTVNWIGSNLPDLTTSGNIPTTPGTRDYLNVFTNSKIFNPLGTAPGTPVLTFLGSAALTPDDMTLVNVGDAPFADRLYAMNTHFQVANATAGATRPEGPAVRWMFYPNGPVQVNDLPGVNLPTGSQGFPARLINTDTFGGIYSPTGAVIATDLETIGAPAYANGVAYQTGWCHMHYPTGNAVNEWDATLIMAYKSSPNMSFVLTDGNGNVVPVPSNTNVDGSINPNAPKLQIKQLNLVTYVPGQPGPPPMITLNENSQFYCDHTSSTFTIYDCKQGRFAESINLALPFQVYSSGAQGNNPIGPLQTNAAGYGLLDNLLWWMVVPMEQSITGILNPQAPPVASLSSDLLDVQPASGPTVIGNSLYYGTQHGHVASVDLTNMPQDGSQATLFAQQNTALSRIHTTPALWDTTANAAIDQAIVNPPVGTTDVVVASSPFGLTALDNQLTLITDNNRLIEVNHLAQASWALDATQTQTLVGGTLNGNGAIASAKISLARPTKATNDTLNTYVVADTGNSRVMQVNKGGIVGWEIHSFNDGMHFLRPGDAQILNSPTDVQTYTLVGNGVISFTSPVTGNTFSYNGYYYSYHYIIADSGNSRVVELVDVYDANGNVVNVSGPGGNVPLSRQLIYVSQSVAEQSKALRYRTVQQFQYPAVGTLLAVVADNTALGGPDPGNTNTVVGQGAVDGNGASVLVFSRSGANSGTLVSKFTALYDPKRNTHTPIAGPTFYQVYAASDGTFHALLCDANGCYDLYQTGTIANVPSNEAAISWALYSTDYLYMTGRPLRASSIQKLGQSDYYQATNRFYPHYLITNRYSGDDNIQAAFGPGLVNVSSSQVRGEVFEVRSDVYFNNAAYPSGYASGSSGYYPSRLYKVSDATYVLGPGYLLANSGPSAIVWMAPKETIPIGTTPSPIKRTIGDAASAGTSSFILEQPTYSERSQ